MVLSVIEQHNLGVIYKERLNKNKKILIFFLSRLIQSQITQKLQKRGKKFLYCLKLMKLFSKLHPSFLGQQLHLKLTAF